MALLQGRETSFRVICSSPSLLCLVLPSQALGWSGMVATWVRPPGGAVRMPFAVVLAAGVTMECPGYEDCLEDFRLTGIEEEWI